MDRTGGLRQRGSRLAAAAAAATLLGLAGWLLSSDPPRGHDGITSSWSRVERVPASPATIPTPVSSAREDLSVGRPCRLRLYHAVGGDPASGLPIDLRDGDRAPDSPPRFSLQADERGQVLLPASSSGGWQVRSRDPYRFLTRDWIPATHERIVVAVGRGGGVAGTILEASGRPAAGAAILARLPFAIESPSRPDIPSFFVRRVTTDDDGRFELQRLPVDAGMSYTIEVDGVSQVVVDDVRAEVGRTRDLGVLRLPARGAVLVHADCAEGSVAEVTLRGLYGAEPSVVSVGRLDHGIRVDGVASGYWQLTVVAPGYRVVSIPSVFVEAGRVAEVEVRAVEGLWLRGVLKSSRGSPVPGCAIRAWGMKNQSRTATTDARGRFAIGGLVPESVVLSALHDGTLEAVTLVDVSQGAAPVEMVLAPVRWLVLRPTVGGLPVEESVWLETDAGLFGARREAVDERGTVVVPMQGEGTMRARVWTRDRSAGARLVIDLSAPTTVERDVVLQPTSTIEVRVSDRVSQAPVADAELTLMAGGDRPRHPGGERAETGLDGTVTLVGVLADERRLRIEHRVYDEAVVDLPVASGGRSRVDVEMTGPPRIEGWVVDPSGARVEGAALEFRDHPSRIAGTDVEGRFAIRVPGDAGRSKLVAYPPDRRVELMSVEETIDLGREQPVRLELRDAREHGASVHGVIADRARFGALRVSVRPYNPRDGSPTRRARVDEAGRYEVLGLEAGRCVVVVESSWGVVALREVTLAERGRVTCDLVTGRATLRVNVESSGSGRRVPFHGLVLDVPVGMPTGVGRGEAFFTDGEGVFERVIPAGVEHHVTAQAGSRVSAPERVTARPGESVEVTLTIDDDSD